MAEVVVSSGELSTQSIFEDVNGDGAVSALDALLLVNHLNSARSSQTAQKAASIEATNQFFAELGEDEEQQDALMFPSIK